MRFDELTHATGEPGFEVVGLWPTLATVPPPPELADLWGPDIRGKPYTHHGPGWIAWLWDFEVAAWPPPDRWLAALEATLRRLHAAGAAIAWMADDLTFADPPSLFTTEMGDNLFAAVSAPTSFVASAKPDGTLLPLPSETRLILLEFAREVIDLSLPDVADLPSGDSPAR